MSLPVRYENTTAEEWATQKYGIIFAEDIKDEPTVYFDMDGTLAVWNNMSLKNPSEAMTLDEIMEAGYFRNLAPIPEMIEKVRYLKEDCKMNVAILSKAYFHAIEEKTEWLRENMPFIDVEKEVFFVPCSPDTRKQNFIPSVGLCDVLIDDYNVNLDEWHGTPIKVITDKNSVRKDIMCFSYDMDNESFLEAIENARDMRVTAYAEDMDIHANKPNYYIEANEEIVREKTEDVLMEALANADVSESVWSVINRPSVLDDLCDAFGDGEFDLNELPDDIVYADLDVNHNLYITFEADSSVGAYSYESIGIKLSPEVRSYLADRQKQYRAWCNNELDEFYSEMLEGKENMQTFTKPINGNKPKQTGKEQ